MSNIFLNVAIIGCGRVANHYRRILLSKEVTGFKIVGVCDLISEKAEEFANDFMCKAYVSYIEMLESIKPDLLIIATPSGLHYEHAKTALNKGVHVLVEKPMTMIPSQAHELVLLAQKRNLMYAVTFQNRLNPAIKILAKAINENRFGKIVTSTIRLRWCRYQDYYNDGWHGTWENDGGVINQQAIHHVDMINWLMGPIESVCSASSNRLNKLEAEDTMVAIIKFQNGALGTIEATTAARPQDFEASISIIGEKGSVVIGGIALNKIETWKFIEHFPEDENVIDQYSQEVPTGYGLSHKEILQNAFDALLNGSILADVSGSKALSTTELIHALYKSEEVNGWVHLKDLPISSRLGNKIKI